MKFKLVEDIDFNILQEEENNDTKIWKASPEQLADFLNMEVEDIPGESEEN